MIPRFLSCIFFFLLPVILTAQQMPAAVYGTVTDSSGAPMEDVNIVLGGTNRGTISAPDGSYRLEVPPGRGLVIYASYILIRKDFQIRSLAEGEQYRLNIILARTLDLEPVEIIGETRKSEPFMQKIEPKGLTQIPSVTGNIESIIKTLPGVSSNNELSSGYSVRGGNFDENLVYINGIEIYRPFLVTSGQQEGLSIINSDMIENLTFSAGGFDATYGDKLSSVLDIRYKEPVGFSGSVTAGIMGANLHLEGSSKTHRFTWLLGARHRTTRNLLSSLDVKGEYNPVSSDLQAYFTYDVTPNLKLGWLTYYGQNRFTMLPDTRETRWGNPEIALQLTIYMDGHENMEYENLLNGITAAWQVSKRTNLNWKVSAYTTNEREYHDVLGQYWLALLETDRGSPDFGKAKYNIGVGSYLTHSRNSLYAFIFNGEHSGSTRFNERHLLQWGAKFQQENIYDKMREWQYLDSAGYAFPRNEEQLSMNRFLNAEIDISSSRYSAYLQHNWSISPDRGLSLNSGIRSQYWDFNNEMILTPRFQFVYEPNRYHNLQVLQEGGDDSLMKRNISLKAAAGLYHQPPFYRELRNLQGVINPEVRAQKSAHGLLGIEMPIDIWKRTFRFNAEAYYKHLWDLVAYELEDVRVRYTAENNATGYVAGIDLQMSGEFIQGLPSWVTLGVMDSRELIDDDYYQNGDSLVPNPGYIPRPTSQLARASILFQDFLPNNPDFKVYLNLVYGARLPYGPPDRPRYRNALTMPPYRRADVGFGWQAISAEKSEVMIPLLKNLESLWLSAEVFNMFAFRNTISYFWARDVHGYSWAVPNYLTSRRFNVRLIAEF